MDSLLKVFCDFDGTAARNDVGNLLFRQFAGSACFDIIQRWKNDEISSKECLIEECRIATVSRRELAEFADAQELDPFFLQFAEKCFSEQVALEIVSDGLDFYIQRILRKYGLDLKIPVHANHLVFMNEFKIKPEFPYFQYSCGKCANCKGYHVQQGKANGRQIVYIGDGLSDRCGAREADVVFAKTGRDLLVYCQENDIKHFPFGDFSDILVQFQTLWPQRVEK